MIEKELADKVLDITKIFMTTYEDKCKIILQTVAKMLVYMISVVTVAMLIVVFVLGVLYVMVMIGNEKHSKKIREFELLQAEKESHYWETISQCADIQLKNLLDSPLQDSSRIKTDAMKLTQEYFTPRKEAISHEDYD